MTLSSIADPETTKQKSAKSTSDKQKKQTKKGEKKPKPKSISSYDFAAWDKFDVDKALESSDEEGTDEHEELKDETEARMKHEKEIFQAVTLKNEGNELYASGKLKEAVAKYTQGIELDPCNAILPANRAMVYIKLEMYVEAEADCHHCLSIDQNYIKGYLRRAKSRVMLGESEYAANDYKKVLELEPCNKDAKRELAKISALQDIFKPLLLEDIKTNKVHDLRKIDPGHWERLPDKILQKILLAVPSYQLPFNELWVCEKGADIIFQPRFWAQKLKMHGICIDHRIWSVLKKFDNHEIVSCLYYASLYQEHRTQQTPISDIIFTIPTDEDVKDQKVWLITDDPDAIQLASGVLVCRRHWHFVNLVLNTAETKGVFLVLNLLWAWQIYHSLKDHYAFWNCTPRFNYFHDLKGNFERAEYLRDFRGCLKTLEGLPSYIDLHISIDKNVVIDPELSRIDEFTAVTLHLKAGTNISDLPKIKFHSTPTFIVSDLKQSHILWMIEVTKKFLLDGCFIIFYNYQLDLISTKNLFKGMAKEGYLSDSQILCSSPTLSYDSEPRLNAFVRKLWSNDLCTFKLTTDLQIRNLISGPRS